MFNHCVAAITLILLSVQPVSAGDQALTLKAGLGYDFISQEYFFDDSLLTDTLDAALALKTTYLDNFKGSFTLGFMPYDDRRLDLRATYEHAKDDVRARLYADWRLGLSGKAKLWLNGELDLREDNSRDEEPGDSHLYGRADSKLTLAVGQSLSLWTRLSVDAVTFDSVSTYNYDHYRLGWKAGLAKTLGDFSHLEADLFGLYRQVPDSSDLDYLSLGAEGSLFLLYERGQFDGFLRLERRDYHLPGSLNDYARVDLDARHKVNTSSSLFLGQELQLETAVFSSDDLLNLNYTRLGLTATVGADLSNLTLSLGPDLERLIEQDDETSVGQDYFEIGLKADLDYVNAAFLFSSVESVLGRRYLDSQGELQSDFTYERLNLITDCTIANCLNFNLMFSAEWEWHDQSDEDNQIFLLSTGLSYTF